MAKEADYCTSKLEIKPQHEITITTIYLDYCTSKLEIKPQHTPL